MKKPRCSKCGRPLKDRVSIAFGIGPVCRGTGNGSRHVQIKSCSSSGRVYAAGTMSGQQMSLFARAVEEQPQSDAVVRLANAPPPDTKFPHSRRDRIAAVKQLRRAAYENREPFQLGLHSRTREPVIYAPISEETWETNDGHQTTHEALGRYLRQYGLI